MNLTEKIKNIGILNQLDLDNKKIILIVLISAIVFYIDINFIFKAQLKGASKSNSEIARVNKELQSFAAEAKKIKDFESAKGVSSRQALKEKKIIPESQFASLLQEISKIANSNEVRILQIKPLHQASSGKLNPILISLELSCGYHNLGRFINGVENLDAFVRVQEIKIEPQEDNYLNQKVSLVLVTYVKK